MPSLKNYVDDIRAEPMTGLKMCEQLPKRMASLNDSQLAGMRRSMQLALRDVEEGTAKEGVQAVLKAVEAEHEERARNRWANERVERERREAEEKALRKKAIHDHEMKMAREIILSNARNQATEEIRGLDFERRSRERLEITKRLAIAEGTRLWAWKKAGWVFLAGVVVHVFFNEKRHLAPYAWLALIVFVAASGALVYYGHWVVRATPRPVTDEMLQRMIDLRCDEICRERVAEERAQNRAIRVAERRIKDERKAARKVRKDEEKRQKGLERDALREADERERMSAADDETREANEAWRDEYDARARASADARRGAARDVEEGGGGAGDALAGVELELEELSLASPSAARYAAAADAAGRGEFGLERTMSLSSLDADSEVTIGADSAVTVGVPPNLWAMGPSGSDAAGGGPEPEVTDVVEVVQAVEIIDETTKKDIEDLDVVDVG